MTIDDFKALWLAYTSALMARDTSRVLACYTDDIVYDESPMMMTQPRRGKERCQAYWSQVFNAFSSISISTTSLAFERDRAWVEWTMNNFHAATRIDVEIQGA